MLMTPKLNLSRVSFFFTVRRLCIYARRRITCALLGVSLQDIKTFILHNYPGVDPNTLTVRVAKALDDCLANGTIRKPETTSEKPAVLGKEGLGQFSYFHRRPYVDSANENPSRWPRPIRRGRKYCIKPLFKRN